MTFAHTLARKLNMKLTYTITKSGKDGKSGHWGVGGFYPTSKLSARWVPFLTSRVTMWERYPTYAKISHKLAEGTASYTIVDAMKLVDEVRELLLEYGNYAQAAFNPLAYEVNSLVRLQGLYPKTDNLLSGVREGELRVHLKESAHAFQAVRQAVTDFKREWGLLEDTSHDNGLSPLIMESEAP